VVIRALTYLMFAMFAMTTDSVGIIIPDVIKTIIAGLTLFAAASYLFAVGNSFLFFAALMAASGIAIGIFKTGALALIGDLSASTREHTAVDATRRVLEQLELTEYGHDARRVEA
jgi:fucose permease